jgi:hypothetical protein
MFNGTASIVHKKGPVKPASSTESSSMARVDRKARPLQPATSTTACLGPTNAADQEQSPPPATSSTTACLGPTSAACQGQSPLPPVPQKRKRGDGDSDDSGVYPIKRAKKAKAKAKAKAKGKGKGKAKAKGKGKAKAKDKAKGKGKAKAKDKSDTKSYIKATVKEIARNLAPDDARLVGTIGNRDLVDAIVNRDFKVLCKASRVDMNDVCDVRGGIPIMHKTEKVEASATGPLMVSTTAVLESLQLATLCARKAHDDAKVKLIVALHGTTLENATNILRTGYDPGAPTRTGNMFGEGLYFTDKPELAGKYAPDGWMVVTVIALVGKPVPFHGRIPPKSAQVVTPLHAPHDMIVVPKRLFGGYMICVPVLAIKWSPCLHPFPPAHPPKDVVDVQALAYFKGKAAETLQQMNVSPGPASFVIGNAAIRQVRALVRGTSVMDVTMLPIGLVTPTAVRHVVLVGNPTDVARARKGLDQLSNECAMSTLNFIAHWQDHQPLDWPWRVIVRTLASSRMF